VPIFQLVPPEASTGPDHEVTLFHPAEMELGETTKMIFEQVRENSPTRVVFDSLSEMRLLAQNSLRYRRQILASSTSSPAGSARCCCSMTCPPMRRTCSFIPSPHGVILLEQMALDYGAERRRLRVTKMRGIAFRAWLP
jgi:circadian clock protein KaiC